MDEAMICLVGEQPLANLLPIRQYRPKHVLLAYTETTKERCLRLREIVSEYEGSKIYVHVLLTVPYSIPKIRDHLASKIRCLGWSPEQLTFNLTGGTKAMALAAYELARQLRGTIIYLDSEDLPQRAYRYTLQGDCAVLEREDQLGNNLISLKEYLDVHLGNVSAKTCPQFPIGEGYAFEREVFHTLSSEMQTFHSVLWHPVQMDLAMRLGNQVGIAELKTGRGFNKKKGIDQLNTACRREALGIYTHKFLIVDKEWRDGNKEANRKLITSCGIVLIELAGFEYNDQTGCGQLSDEDKNLLVRAVREEMNPRPDKSI